MISVTLPDGAKREYQEPLNALAIATSISPKLAKQAIAAKVDGKLVDLSYVINKDVTIEILGPGTAAALEILRHSCAHLLAHAVKELFPDAKVTIGPVIEHGFYYDFYYERAFTPEDLTAIEAKMHALAAMQLPIMRQEMPREAAIDLFRNMQETYKVEIIESIPVAEIVSCYKQGSFIDLCRGPHVASTAKIKVFKLLKVAGAYWRGDANNVMLQRIYGTAFFERQELEAYLTQIEEAEKRDHRKLAKKFDLFHMQDEAPGMVFWHPKGWSIYLELERYIRNKIQAHGYHEVRTPQLVEHTLWKKSGHWEVFGVANMFSLEAHEQVFCLKPMNCPCHIQIFNQGIKSYRDLPYRMAEFGSCHRNEPKGALHGLLRVRNFTQDDAHIFCTEDQIQNEVEQFNQLLFEVYRDMGFTDIIVRLSTRPDNRVGSDAIWDKAENALVLALNAAKIAYTIYPGEGAFYGPKIEFALKDSIGRVWQCGTLQLDFFMPERLGAEYVSESGERKVPVMIHRAILGSIERFIGILLEETSGALPVWLAPIQVVVLNITDNQETRVQEICKRLMQESIRVVADVRNEKIGFKIREYTLQKIPYLIIIGDKEVNNGTIAVRTRDAEQLGNMQLEDFIELLSSKIKTKGGP